MSRPPRGYRQAIVVATMLLAALALGGCSAGTVTQTDTIVSGAAGGFGSVNGMVLRDVSIDSGEGGEFVPAGAPAPLGGTIVNIGATTDRLVSVSTPYAVTVVAEGTTVIPGSNAVRIVGAEPGPVGPANLDDRLSGTMRLTLQGSTQALRPGPTYPITFTFERAGSVTIPVIVVGAGPSAG